MNNTKEAKVLDPNQDLKINAALMGMWKKAGLRVKSFKATKKGHNEIWAGEFKTKNAILSMSVNKYGNVFYHAGNKSVNIGRLDKQSRIIDWMKAIIRNAPWAESVTEAVYQFKSFTNTQMDRLDAELHRGGFRGTPDFNKMTYTTDEISPKLDKIVKRKGGKKIKESVNENLNWKRWRKWRYSEEIIRNEVHAKTKKELKAAIAKSMNEILTGKTPKYDIINGMTGEMIGWKDGKEYIWQPHAIPDAMRELK